MATTPEVTVLCRFQGLLKQRTRFNTTDPVFQFLTTSLPGDCHQE